jgi:hypothetical protein
VVRRASFHVATPLLAGGVALLVACGARTRLLLGEDVGGAGGGGAGGVSLNATCQAALQNGAPTPMQDYCPTHAGQALMVGPRSPQIIWTANPYPVRNPEGSLPAWIVVDALGHIFGGIDDSPFAPTAPDFTSTLFALDPDGNTLWTQSFPGTVGHPSIGVDGTLWVTGVGGVQDQPSSFLAGMTAGAPAIVTLQPPPIDTPFGPLQILPEDFAFASDGSFLIGGPVQENQGPSPFAMFGRLTTAEALLWHWPTQLDAANGVQLVGPLLGTQNDGVVAVTGEGLLALGATGQESWQISPAPVAAAVDPQGDVVEVLQSGPDGLALVTVGPGGHTRSTAPLGSQHLTLGATRLAVAADGTRLVLLADESPSPGLTTTHVQVLAFDSSGASRWKSAFDATMPYDPAAPGTHYGLFVDADGTVVVTAGAITGIDLRSGSVVWTLQPAYPHQCLRPAVLAAGGSIVATQCDGTIFLARDR